MLRDQLQISSEVIEIMAQPVMSPHIVLNLEAALHRRCEKFVLEDHRTFSIRNAEVKLTFGKGLRYKFERPVFGGAVSLQRYDELVMHGHWVTWLWRNAGHGRKQMGPMINGKLMQLLDGIDLLVIIDGFVVDADDTKKEFTPQEAKEIWGALKEVDRV